MNESPVRESSETISPGTVTNAFETLTVAAVTGTVLNNLEALVPGRTGKSQGYSYNQVVKVLNTENLLPANFTTISYGLMKANQKIQLNTVIGALSHEANGKEIFEKM